MIALLDADIFAYEFGSCKDMWGRPLPWPLVQSRVTARIEGILDAVEAETYQLYLTSEDKSNFRIERASIRPYKGHRATEKPHWYKAIREYLVKHRGAEEVSGYEADDALSIAQIEDWNEVNDKGFLKYEQSGVDTLESYYDYKVLCETIICSLDKDLMMVPGWHYNWRKNETTWVSEREGLRSFYKQSLTGDSTDNIPGLFGVGISSKLLKDLDDFEDELSMYCHVQAQYEKRFGSYWRLFLEENGALLWMLRSEDTEEWSKRLEKLEKERQATLTEVA